MKPKLKRRPTALIPDIVKLLKAGHSVASVAKKTGRTKRWIHMVSVQEKVPKNRPVTPGSTVESSIIRTLVKFGYNITLTAKAHNQSPAAIGAVVTRVQGKRNPPPSPRVKPPSAPQRSSPRREHRLYHPRRQPREKALAFFQPPSGSR